MPSEHQFPAYTYVPGRFPHPVSHPDGHSYGAEPPAATPLVAADWADCEEFLWGFQLMARGYYWEAHEAWEAVWIQCGRTGLVADFLKGLIKLAAAMVKAREGRPAGVHRHAERAAQLFGQVQHRRNAAGEHDGYFAGLRLDSLRALATHIGEHPEQYLSDSAEPVVCLLDLAPLHLPDHDTNPSDAL